MFPRTANKHARNSYRVSNIECIDIGSVHRIANPGKIPLELIEVRTGSYLGEDDIDWIENVYKRS